MPWNPEYYKANRERMKKYGRDYYWRHRREVNNRALDKRIKEGQNKRYALFYRVIYPDGIREKTFESYNELSKFFGLAESSIRHYVHYGKKIYGYTVQKIY